MNVFDIIGPVMIGPSSSHTAGAVRLGRVAWKILGERAVRAEIQLSGSFAQTYQGHGTDKALVAGIMGMHSDDERIRNSLQLAQDFRGDPLNQFFIDHPKPPRFSVKIVGSPAKEVRRPFSMMPTRSSQRSNSGMGCRPRTSRTAAES